MCQRVMHLGRTSSFCEVNIRCCAALAVIALLVPSHARAEYEPEFDMDSCVGTAELIVSGYLDRTDTIAVTEVFAGGPVGATVQLKTWGRGFRDAARFDDPWREPSRWKTIWNWLLGPRRIEVVAFLRKGADDRWATLGRIWGLVPLKGDGVYPLTGWAYDDRQPFYRRAEFFDGLREAVQAKTERVRILASSRTLDRSGALVRLALQHRELRGPPESFETRFFHLSKIAEGLQEASAEEGEVMLRALREAAAEHEKVRALRLIPLVPLGTGAFDEVVPYIDRGQSAEIRRAAMFAAGAVDPYRAVDIVGPLLTRSEPELETALQSLRFPYEDYWNGASIDHLLRLAEEFRNDRRPEVPSQLDYQVEKQLSQLEMVLTRLAHPRLLPLLVDYSHSQNRFSVNASRTLGEITGLKVPPENGGWQRWRESSRRYLEPGYDLDREEGRRAWIESWAAGDPATRKLLVNLWFFEPRIEAANALFLAAPAQEATRAVLSELWERKRLTPEFEKAIVERYLEVELEEGDSPDGFRPKESHLAIRTNGAFKFPRHVGVQSRAQLTIDGKPVNEVSRWEDAGSGMLADVPGERWGARVEGQQVGARTIQGVVEMRCMDHWPKSKERWIARWNVGPLQLKEVPGKPGK
jgi:hypothetical protein